MANYQQAGETPVTSTTNQLGNLSIASAPVTPVVDVEEEIQIASSIPVTSAPPLITASPKRKKDVEKTRPTKFVATPPSSSLNLAPPLQAPPGTTSSPAPATSSSVLPINTLAAATAPPTEQIAHRDELPPTSLIRDTAAALRDEIEEDFSMSIVPFSRWDRNTWIRTSNPHARSGSQPETWGGDVLHNTSQAAKFAARTAQIIRGEGSPPERSPAPALSNRTSRSANLPEASVTNDLLPPLITEPPSASPTSVASVLAAIQRAPAISPSEQAPLVALPQNPLAEADEQAMRNLLAFGAPAPREPTQDERDELYREASAGIDEMALTDTVQIKLAVSQDYAINIQDLVTSLSRLTLRPETVARKGTAGGVQKFVVTFSNLEDSLRARHLFLGQRSAYLQHFNLEPSSILPDRELAIISSAPAISLETLQSVWNNKCPPPTYVEISYDKKSAILRWDVSVHTLRPSLPTLGAINLGAGSAASIPAPWKQFLLVGSPFLLWNTTQQRVENFAIPIKRIYGINFIIVAARKPDGQFRQMVLIYCPDLATLETLRGLSGQIFAKDFRQQVLHGHEQNVHPVYFYSPREVRPQGAFVRYEGQPKPAAQLAAPKGLPQAGQARMGN